MKRREFIQKASLVAAAGLTCGLDRLFAESPIALAAGVPQPPQPPKPPSLFAGPNPPYAQEIPATPFDAPPGSWTLVGMPDTQNMDQGEYSRQTEWIVAHQKSHNILFVAHEGDIVEVSTDLDNWKRAQTAMRILTDAGIPYALLPGNHDLGRPDSLLDRVTDVHHSFSRFTYLNNYFSAEDYRHSEAMGLFEPGKMENSWHTFTAPTGDYLLVALEYAPRNEAVEWADRIVAQCPTRKVIILTHAYTNCDNTTRVKLDITPAGRDSANDGDQIWEKLVRKHRNIFLVLSGHVCNTGTGYLVSTGNHGQRVHQILANYQALVVPHRPYHGGAYLRLMQFYPDGETVQVKSYSPWLDDWLMTPDQQFRFTI
ncbi:MAG: metallophosphoesterase [Methylacidiphilales bacterium]|nr:metallophosphoesterase [Candidatus Methylacidiphilales bacterium]